MSKSNRRAINRRTYESMKLTLGMLIVAGYWDDSTISIDRAMIEAHVCPKCHRFLIYKGLSNKDEYRAYGVCGGCDYIRKFWVENVPFAEFKKKFSQATVGAK